jgi:hypothetical protein
MNETLCPLGRYLAIVENSDGMEPTMRAAGIDRPSLHSEYRGPDPTMMFVGRGPIDVRSPGIWQRLLPFTTGDWHGFPFPVRAPRLGT